MRVTVTSLASRPNLARRRCAESFATLQRALNKCGWMQEATPCDTMPRLGRTPLNTFEAVPELEVRRSARCALVPRL